MRVLYTLTAILILNHCLAQRFDEVPEAIDKTYGYTPENPLKLKKGQPARSTDYAITFLANLETEEGQPLILVKTSLVSDPKYAEPVRIVDYGALTVASGVQSPLHAAVPIDNVVTKGILQEYTFKTPDNKNTFHLYVDIYHRDDLQIPGGLRLKADKVVLD